MTELTRPEITKLLEKENYNMFNTHVAISKNFYENYKHSVDLNLDKNLIKKYYDVWIEHSNIIEDIITEYTEEKCIKEI